MIASANMSLNIRSLGLDEDADQDHAASVSAGDDQLQPEAGAGVDHLAQLDAGSGGGRTGFMRGPP